MATRTSMAALRAPISFANPYGGMDQNAINEEAAQIETFGARDARIRHGMAMDALREEAARQQVRAMDPTQAAMDQGRAADWQAGFFRNNPQVREARRQSAIFEGGTTGAAQGEADVARYFSPGMGDVRESQQRNILEQYRNRYFLPEAERTRREGIRQTGAVTGRAITAAGQQGAARTAAAGRQSAAQIASQPGSFETATGWYEEQTGGGPAVKYSEIAAAAREAGMDINDAIEEMIAAGRQIDFRQ